MKITKLLFLVITIFSVLVFSSCKEDEKDKQEKKEDTIEQPSTKSPSGGSGGGQGGQGGQAPAAQPAQPQAPAEQPQPPAAAPPAQAQPQPPGVPPAGPPVEPPIVVPPPQPPVEPPLEPVEPVDEAPIVPPPLPPVPPPVGPVEGSGESPTVPPTTPTVESEETAPATPTAIVDLRYPSGVFVLLFDLGPIPFGQTAIDISQARHEFDFWLRDQFRNSEFGGDKLNMAIVKEREGNWPRDSMFLNRNLKMIEEEMSHDYTDGLWRNLRELLEQLNTRKIRLIVMTVHTSEYSRTDIIESEDRIWILGRLESDLFDWQIIMMVLIPQYFINNFSLERLEMPYLPSSSLIVPITPEDLPSETQIKEIVSDVFRRLELSE